MNADEIKIGQAVHIDGEPRAYLVRLLCTMPDGLRVASLAGLGRVAIDDLTPGTDEERQQLEQLEQLEGRDLRARA